LVFPFGLTKDATWEPRRQAWTCRFLVPRDTPDGVYDVKVAVRMSDHRRAERSEASCLRGCAAEDARPDKIEWLAMHYVVDTTAPLVKLQVKGRARPGRTVEIVARQIITEAELKTSRKKIKAYINPDIKSIVAIGPDGKPITFNEDIVGKWHALYTIPASAHGPLSLKFRVVDVADNAREMTATISTGLPLGTASREAPRLARLGSPMVPDTRLGSR
jgi:hypothetical protein